MTTQPGRSDGTIDVRAVIDDHGVGRFQLRVVALCAAVVFMDGFDTQAIGYVAPAISKAWNLLPGALGPVIGAGLFGLMLGALVLGPVADRVGRKPVIVACTLFFGICALMTITADNLTSLLIWRFVTGLGLGGAMPNTIALTAEYSPQRSRATMIMVMFIGFSLGSAVGGLIAAQIVPRFGWTGVFVVGGIIPIVLAPILAVWLPESIRLLTLEGTQGPRVAGLLRRIDPALKFDPGARFVALEEHPPGLPVVHLFTEGRAVSTILLWVMFFMNLLDLYFLASWLPTVINNAGLSVQFGQITTVMFQVGGIVGTLIMARLIERLGPFRVLAAAYFVAALFIVAIGLAGASAYLIMAAVVGAGFCIVGAQIGANALTATYYPTFIRSTGVGWALGIGRIGSIIGPVLGGIVLALHWHLPTIFFAGAVPAFIAAVAVFCMGEIVVKGSAAAAAKT